MTQNLFNGCEFFVFPHTAYTQMMSFGIRDKNGKFIMIDGGNVEEGRYLENFLVSNGIIVNEWFITHAHSDHIDALTYILKSGKVKIERIYFNFPPVKWLYFTEPDSEQSTEAFLNAVKTSGAEVISPKKGESFDFGDISFKALTNPEENTGDGIINNSSLVLRMDTPGISVLFLGDLEISGGQRLMKDFPEEIKCEGVQMAHHGQHGVSEEFYDFVKPQYCFWPTPTWLYNNDSGGGYGSGDWETLQTRRQTEKLGVKRNFVSENNFQVIR